MTLICTKCASGNKCEGCPGCPDGKGCQCTDQGCCTLGNKSILTLGGTAQKRFLSIMFSRTAS